MTFEDDIAYFNEIKGDLAKEHTGKFVLIKDHRNYGIFSNFEDAHKAALEKFGVVEVVIEEIGTTAPLNYYSSQVG
jgi:hypothetical protein